MTSCRYSCVGAGIRSLEELPDLKKQAAQVRTLCLHGNRVESLQGIHELRSLTDLNVSSNELQNTQSLKTLAALTSVNLASNRLQNVDGLQDLPQLQRLTLAHNQLRSLSSFTQLATNRHSLKYLDLQNNQITSIQELAVLKLCTSLRHLKIAGGFPGNPICNIPGFQHLVVQMLPQLDLLDDLSCSQIQAQHWPDVSTEQPQYFQPLLQQQHHHHLQSVPVMLSSDALMQNSQPLALPAPAAAQQEAPALSGAAGTASVQARVVKSSGLNIVAAHSQDDRIAALESRLRDVVSMRSRPPLVATENLLHQPLALRKVRSKAVVHEVACQTATSMTQLDRLHSDAAHLKQELQSLAGELDKRTSNALRVEEQAEAVVQEVQQHAEQRVCSYVLYLTNHSLPVAI